MDGFIEQGLYTTSQGRKTLPIAFTSHVAFASHVCNRDAWGTGNVQNYQYNFYFYSLSEIGCPGYNHYFYCTGY